MPLYKLNLAFFASHLKLLINKAVQFFVWLPISNEVVYCGGMNTGLETNQPGSSSASNLLPKYKLEPYLHEP